MILKKGLNYIKLFSLILKKEYNFLRENEHDLLMRIRAGEYLNNEQQLTAEFFALVDSLEKRLNYAKENTSLSKNPDYEKINEFMMSVNERVVKNEL